MIFFKWLCNLMIIFFLIGLILKAGIIFVNILLLICMLIFTLDLLTSGRRHT
ncbi:MULTISPECIES: hypothetical protein [Clostridium]|uniref:Uncharacterized protein n=1 Tax=Clostridium lapidicellarium TaxID=3240931 RepID=A0ABV4DYA8_9CLOT